MASHVVNLGILAHIDAGKTSLTERLLFEHGTVTTLGSVDSGTTYTDAGELERRRGITIRSAVASFTVGDLQVNLVDTPGHPDFIAEVERALSVLDGAVLVISAVEGVQAQTRVLMRSLRRLRLPTVIFVNKIDRMGARYDGLLTEIRRRLVPSIVPMQRVLDLGTRAATVLSRSLVDEGFRAEVAELLADNDDDLLRRVIEVRVADDDLPELLEAQTAAALVHPVFFGSALSGAGTPELTAGIGGLLAAHRPPPADGPPRGTVFAIERSGGEKVGYLRLFSGTLRRRQRVTFRRRDGGGAVDEHSGRIAGLRVEGDGSGPLTAGNIARIRGLPQLRVGDQLCDQLGEPADGTPPAQFAPPILESVVRPRQAGRESDLHAALTRLADEDPLIRTRPAAGGATSVLLYGAVQREVLAERLSREFGLDAVFDEVRPVYFERPGGVGLAVHEFVPHSTNEFWQTLGVRIEPAEFGAGNEFVREAHLGLLPRAYHRAIEESAMAALRQGRYGWEVTDCRVVVTRVGYEAPLTTAADFRNLTPIVVGRALRRAGTTVHEPSYTFEVEVPEDARAAVVGLLVSLGADVGQARDAGPAWIIPGEVAARSLRDIAVALPGLTRGEGAIWYEPGSDRRVRGPVPVRHPVRGLTSPDS